VNSEFKLGRVGEADEAVGFFVGPGGSVEVSGLDFYQKGVFDAEVDHWVVWAGDFEADDVTAGEESEAGEVEGEVDVAVHGERGDAFFGGIDGGDFGAGVVEETQAERGVSEFLCSVDVSFKHVIVIEDGGVGADISGGIEEVEGEEG